MRVPRKLHLVPLVPLVALAAACSDAAPPLEPGSTPLTLDYSAPLTDDFDVLDPARWLPGDHALGRGWLDPANVAASAGSVALILPAGRTDGAEIRSVDRHGYGSYLARMRTPLAPGSISAFFLYQGVAGDRSDEIDIEIYNDGSRRVMFTVWVAGKQTHTVTRTLPFDPAAAYHDYRIEYGAGKVRFSVDGAVMQEWTSRTPKNTMYVMSNSWWPTWLTGAPADTPRALLVDRIEY